MPIKTFRKTIHLLGIKFTETKSRIFIVDAPCQNGCNGGNLSLSKRTECGFCSRCGLKTWSFGDAAARFGVSRIFDSATSKNYARGK